MRMRNSLRGLGDPTSISDIVAGLAQYTSDQVMQAYQTVVDTYQSENNDYVGMVTWWSANKDTLTPEGKQQFLAGLQAETEVVNGMLDSLSTFSAVLNHLGMNTQVPGLSGVQRRLGAFPVVVVAVVVAVISICIGAGVWEYYQSQSQLAHEQTEQAKQKIMQQAQANVPALVAAGWTPAQIADYLKAQQDANKESASFPWGMLAVGGVVVVGIKALLG